MAGTKRDRERMKRILSSPQPSDELTQPEGLLAYWGWLITRTHTEPIEFFLALLSAWFFIIILGVSQLPPERWSGTVAGMNHIMPLLWWSLLLLFGAGAKLLGLAFRITILRLLGLLASVGFWLTISSVMFYILRLSPVWGGYVIIGLVSAWAFVRVTWRASDPIAYWLRGKLEDRGHHVRRDKHE